MRKISYLGSNLPAKLFETLKKKAHDVWDLDLAPGDRVMAVRKKQDTARVSEEKHETAAQGLQELLDLFSGGDKVFLYMGGRKLNATVASSSGGLLTLDTQDGQLDNIPSEWVTRLAAACRCQCGCKNSADGSLGKCKNCNMVGCG